jgi:DNA-binding transcriptional LysR family regulator
MELRHLRYFVAVAQDLHFTRAAERLGIAQPPLTFQIKALERELGVQLFDRTGRRVLLTEAGKAFFDDARAILDQVARASAKANRIGQGLSGRLRVGFTESASFNPLVAGTVRAFRTAFPDIDLELEESPSTRLAAAIRANELDLAFVRPPLQNIQGLTLETLAHEPMLAALPVDHPLAAAASLKLQDLACERFILYPRAIRPGLSDEVIAACQAAGFTPTIVQETPQLSSTVNLVATGLGISIVPACLRQVRPQAVRFVPIEDLDLNAHLGLLHRVVEGSAAVARFKALIAEIVGKVEV